MSLVLFGRGPGVAGFNPAGVIGVNFVTAVRSDLAGGLKSRADILKVKNFNVGRHGEPIYVHGTARLR